MLIENDLGARVIATWTETSSLMFEQVLLEDQLLSTKLQNRSFEGKQSFDRAGLGLCVSAEDFILWVTVFGKYLLQS